MRDLNQVKPMAKQEPVQVTHSGSNDQLLYFTSTSLLDGGELVFISDRTGHPNLYLLDFQNRKEWQLTRNAEGWLKSYVYFDGNPYRGLGKASISLDAKRGLVYYIQGRDIRVVDRSGQERVLAELPKGQMTAFTHVSADGTRLCVPTVDARALDDEKPLPVPKPGHDIDDRVHAEGLSSYLRVYDTSTGREVETVVVPRAWITHVQFSPIDNRLILYNHEWCSFDCGIRRMWLWDGTRHLQLRQETTLDARQPRSRHDWTCHEMWERDGSAIIYHGGYHKGPSFLGRVRPDGSEATEISLPADWTQYGHFTVGAPGQLVSDGYYQTPETKEGNGQWISLLQVDWNCGQIDWQPMARHGSSWSSQDTHPHPIISHDTHEVYFTSDRSGKRAVYRLEI